MRRARHLPVTVAGVDTHGASMAMCSGGQVCDELIVQVYLPQGKSVRGPPGSTLWWLAHGLHTVHTPWIPWIHRGGYTVYTSPPRRAHAPRPQACASPCVTVAWQVLSSLALAGFAPSEWAPTLQEMGAR
jgi:hypothetical protein